MYDWNPESREQKQGRSNIEKVVGNLKKLMKDIKPQIKESLQIQAGVIKGKPEHLRAKKKIFKD